MKYGNQGINGKNFRKEKITEWRFDKKRGLWATWHRFDGVSHVKRGFLTESDAQDYLKELGIQERLKKIGVVKPVKFPTVKKLLDKHLESFTSANAKTQATRVYRDFRSKLPVGIKIDELKRKHFKDYSDERSADGVENETIDREITDISAAIHTVCADEGRSRIVTQDERERLITYLLREKEPQERIADVPARRRTGLIAYFAPLTGLRHGEIAALKKSDFDESAHRLKAAHEN